MSMNVSNIVGNPHRAEFERTTQNMINKWHGIIKTLDTDWKVIHDEDGQMIDIVPNWHITFKDGRDFVMELKGANGVNTSGVQNVH